MPTVNPIVVFLPGMHGTGELWLRFRARWHEPFVEVSYLPDPEATLDDYAAQVEHAVLLCNPLGAPVDLVAESFSGPVALLVVQRQRIVVRRLVLIASFATRFYSRLMAMINAVPTAWLSPRYLPRFFIDMILLNGRRDLELSNDVVRVVHTIPPTLILSRVRIVSQLGAHRFDCHIPVLAIRAERDRLLPSSVMEGIRSACRDLRVVDVDGPHFLMQAMPERCALEIHAFLALKIPETT
jgi:pimeloyl-[acyl-carrier protein] methyl ester esterase